MDVIVEPVTLKHNEWRLDDRLGRNLGKIRVSEQEVFSFLIEPSAASALCGVFVAHKSLDEAMSAIAKHMNGSCQLNSKDWD